MQPKRCPECKSFLSEDAQSCWCDHCDYEEVKIKPINWKKVLDHE